MLNDTRVDASSDRYRSDQTTALAHEQLRAEWTRAATPRTDQRRHRHPLLLGAQAFELFEDIRHASVFGHVIDRVKPQTPDFARAGRVGLDPGPMPIPPFLSAGRHSVPQEVPVRVGNARCGALVRDGA